MIKRVIYSVMLGFLSFSCVASCSKDSGLKEEVIKDIPEGDVTVFVTSSNRAYDFERMALDFSSTSNMSPTTITLNPEVRYQQIHGFGAAVTGSSSYNLLQMTREDRARFLTETFCHDKGMGFSYTRISIGASDFSLSEYTLCDTPGIENFSLQHEELEYIIPVLKEILEINPGLKIMGSPWTPPRWMKVNNLNDLQPHNSWTGGRLNPVYYEDYAAYFVKWIQAFADHGIEITSVTPQNEPLHPGNSVSLYMTWQEQREFVKYMGRAFQEAGLSTKIYVFDHNYNYDNIADQVNYPIHIYSDEEARQFVAGAAYHDYGGHHDELLNIHSQAPDMELVFTESSIGTWNDGRNLSHRLMADVENIGLSVVNKWGRAVIVWNLMLDMNRGPNRPGGCTTCFGTVDISNDYSSITRNSHYYMLGHLSSVIKPGATRIGTSGFSDAGINYTAVENIDGTYGFVIKNDTAEARSITISDGEKHFTYRIPARSVASYRWEK
ncbi:glycoside hydrolase family 30 protein [Natronoflexus pectinivorans]|uniref:Glucosylceramidase n=1 Tax=Natronoflexus pectinivorans TaxID=682526 RepID=A0A4R2GLY4_9BACT|nr:glycoside hydrolase family 30 beta sandwich domain-containing protein [Natronoflexus pectinivorans]TCO09708.1 glucosylceramidase [Natronoflexus pectinivorans]